MLSLRTAPRSLPADSFRWMRWDLPLRVVPMALLPLGLVWLTPLRSSDLGLGLPSLSAVLLGLLLAVPMGYVSWWFRLRFVGRVVVPSTSDNLLQSSYYILLNAPAEELFFRGLTLGGLRSFIGLPAAWLVATLAFGLYHIPARWGRNAVAGVTLAGALFGALYVLSGGLWVPVIVHAFATCGFLSFGPWAALRMELRRAGS